MSYWLPDVHRPIDIHDGSQLVAAVGELGKSTRQEGARPCISRRKTAFVKSFGYNEGLGDDLSVARLTFRPVKRLEDHRGCVNRLAWHPTGQILASVSDDRRAILWKFPESIGDIKLLQGPEREGASQLVENPDSAGGDAEDSDMRLARLFVRQFAAREERLRARGSREGARTVDDTKIQIFTQHHANIFGVAFLPANPMAAGFSQNDHLATGGLDQEVHIYDISSGIPLSRYFCHSGAVCSLSISNHCADVFWTASDDGTVRQFDRRVPHRCRPDPNCSNCLLSAHLGEVTRPSQNVKWSMTKSDDVNGEGCDRFNARHLQRLTRVLSSQLDLLDSRTRFCQLGMEQAPKAQQPDIFQEMRNCISSRLKDTRSCRFLSVAPNPDRPEYLLVGASDPMLRIYDRRMLPIGRKSEFDGESYAFSHIPVEVHAPQSIGHDPIEIIVGDVRNIDEYEQIRRIPVKYPTHVEWRQDGREFIATYHDDAIYTFPFELDRAIERRGAADGKDFESPDVSRVNKRPKDGKSNGCGGFPRVELGVHLHSYVTEHVANRCTVARSVLSYDEAFKLSEEYLMRAQMREGCDHLFEAYRWSVKAGNTLRPSLGDAQRITQDIGAVFNLSDEYLAESLSGADAFHAIVGLTVGCVYREMFDVVVAEPKQTMQVAGKKHCEAVGRIFLKQAKLRMAIQEQELKQLQQHERQRVENEQGIISAALMEALTAMAWNAEDPAVWEILAKIMVAREDFMMLDTLLHLAYSKFFSDQALSNKFARDITDCELKLCERFAQEAARVTEPSQGTLPRSLFRTSYQSAARPRTPLGPITYRPSPAGHPISSFDSDDVSEVRSPSESETFRHQDLTEAEQNTAPRSHWDSEDSSSREWMEYSPEEPEAQIRQRRRRPRRYRNGEGSLPLITVPSSKSELNREEYQTRLHEVKQKFNCEGISRCFAIEHVKGGRSPFQQHALLGFIAERQFGIRQLWKSIMVEKNNHSGAEQTGFVTRSSSDWKAKRLVMNFNPLAFKCLPEKNRYEGFANMYTDIKECAFWGTKYIMGASDGGAVYIWRQSDGVLLEILQGHDDSVNCVRPHPFDPLLATSGIDDYIQLWSHGV